MDIPRASFAQFSKGNDGREVLITEDACDVAKRLGEISDRLYVRYSEAGEFFRVVERTENGSEHTVTTATELTPALVEHVRMLGSEQYDLAKEAERIDKQAEKDKDHQFSEQMGERGELLAHALRKDKGVKQKQKIIVPRSV